jgi:hypothetical protein
MTVLGGTLTETCVLQCSRACRDDPRRPMPGLLACGGCRKRLVISLIELPGMYDRLVAAHTAGGGTSEIRAGGHAGLALSDAVTRARAELRTMLATWCRAVAEDIAGGRTVHLPADTTAAMAGYLLGHRGSMLDWILGQDWAEDFAAGILAVHGDAWRALYARTSDTSRIPVAPCSVPFWSDVASRVTFACPGQLVVRVRDGDPLPDAVCDWCEREVPPVQWRRLADRDLRLTVPELAVLWRIPAQTVYRWATDDAWLSDGGRPARYSVADAERTLTRLRMGVAS